MNDTTQILNRPWSLEKAVLLSFACLVLGVAGGWAIPGLHEQKGSNGQQVATTGPTPSSISAPNGQANIPGPAQLKQMADTQAAPTLEKLKADPQNADLLVSAGNIYYDAQQYPVAISLYGRALQVRPSDAAVRTDMATAYWYTGNTDTAIAEFNQALTYAPTNPNTLFNLGLVEWQGKKDAASAIAQWEKLLAANPNYQGRGKVEQMLAEAKKQSPVKP